MPPRKLGGIFMIKRSTCLRLCYYESIVKNLMNKKIKNKSKREMIFLYVAVVIILIILFFVTKWSIENILFKDFFKNYQF